MDTLTARNATLADMVEILRHQRTRRLDVIAPATAIHAHEGNLIIANTVHHLTAAGVTRAAGTYRPTQVADEGLAAKLGINLAYLRKLRAERPDLWDANVNGWLHGNDLAGIPPDNRKFLLRLFQPGGDDLGIARAVLSDSYKLIDNLDALMATLDGIRQAGVDVEFDGLDLSERRLYARVVAPEIRAYAPGLLAGYRSPFGGEAYIPGRAWTPEQARAAAAREGRGYAPGSEPVLFAGFVISNSEVGEGAWSITPGSSRRSAATACRSPPTSPAPSTSAPARKKASSATAPTPRRRNSPSSPPAPATRSSPSCPRTTCTRRSPRSNAPPEYPSPTRRRRSARSPRPPSLPTRWPMRSWPTSSAAASSPPAASCKPSLVSPGPSMTRTPRTSWKLRRCG
jgi:hypothetical protein